MARHSKNYIIERVYWELNQYRKCKVCGGPVMSHKANVRYCSDFCRMAAQREMSRVSQRKRRENIQ